MINIAAWDNDFISPCINKAVNNEAVEEIIQMKHQYILEKFPCLKKENTQIYRLLERDYQYSYGLSGELEKKVSDTTYKCLEAYRTAKKECNFDLVRSQFAELIAIKREELECLYVEGTNTYYKLLNYSCGKLFTPIIDNIMNIIKNEFCSAAKLEKNNLQEYVPLYISIEDYKKLLKKYEVNYKNVIFQKDITNSCLQLSSEDCRITYTSEVSENIAKHEIGHIIYMQNISNELPYKTYCNPASQVFDEAIAMLYEMMVDGIDELKYSCLPKNPIRIKCTNIQRLLHVVLRYELEKELINGEIDALKINQIWKERFKEYFGYEINSDEEGILQDAHWFCGEFGYFPIYNVAFALALVIYYKLGLDRKEYKEIYLTLKKHILQYGASKSEEELFNIIGIENFENDFEKYFKSLFFNRN